MTVRPATQPDVPAMSAVLTASVAELCHADHHGNPDNIARWVSNKTPEGLAAMLADPERRFFVAERAGEVAAVGAVSREGVVILNYVAPAYRFQGVSRALLAHMEQVLAGWGYAEARLVSTTTARRFYLEAGWVEDGLPDTSGFGVCYPMRKQL